MDKMYRPTIVLGSDNMTVVVDGLKITIYCGDEPEGNDYHEIYLSEKAMPALWATAKKWHLEVIV